MQENRSYDHYFGRLLPRRRHRPTATRPNPNPLGGDPIQPFHQTNYCDDGRPRPRLERHASRMEQRSHGRLHGRERGPDRPDRQPDDGLLQAQRPALLLQALQDVRDERPHFCSVLGPTFPNRYYLLAGTSFGHVNNAFPDSSGANDPAHHLQPARRGTTAGLLEDLLIPICRSASCSATCATAPPPTPHRSRSSPSMPQRGPCRRWRSSIRRSWARPRTTSIRPPTSSSARQLSPASSTPW